MPEAVDIGIHRFDRAAAVVGRRGDRRGVNQVLVVAEIRAKRLGYVMLFPTGGSIRERNDSSQRRHPADEIIQNRYLDWRMLRVTPAPVQRSLNEIVTEETRPSSDEHAPSCHLGELRPEMIRDQIQVGLYDVFGSLH